MYLINEGGGGLKRTRGTEIFVKFNKPERGGKRGVGISKNPLKSVMNKKRDKCLILMLNLKVSKQTRSEASKNKVIIRRASNISINYC